MAENKKSFVLYADLIKSIEHLTNEEKGILFNHLLEYVNDMNPVLTDRLILTAWKPIELQLKRDLIKFEEVKAKRSEAGKRSAELRALRSEEQNQTNSTSVESVEQNLTNSTVNVNDNDNDNDNDSDNDNVNVINNNKPTVSTKFSFFRSLIDLGVEKQVANDWLAVRKTKKLTNTETAFKNLMIEFEKCGKPIPEIIEKCVINSWGGFKASWDSKDENKIKQQSQTNLIKGIL